MHDRRTLSRLECDGPDSFLSYLVEGDNHTRVCSAGCIFALATALAGSTVTVLHYHQAVDQSSQNCVTCAAVALT